MECSDDCQEVWTELEWLVLRPEERAESCPPDTRLLPYMARTRGMALRPVVGSAGLTCGTQRHSIWKKVPRGFSVPAWDAGRAFQAASLSFAHTYM